MTIGDVKSEAKGSGARYNSGKPAMDLVPLMALEDCAKVFDYGRRKYAVRGDCTCQGGSKAEHHRQKVLAEMSTKNSCEKLIPNMLRDRGLIAESGIEKTETELNLPKQSAVSSVEQIIQKPKSTDELSVSTVYPESSTRTCAKPAAPSAGVQKDCTLTTATPQEKLEEYFAIPATSALDFSKGLEAGLNEHSPTCGVHKTSRVGEWNWAKGMDWSVPYACMLRHLSAWHKGEDVDPESGLPHLGHAMCNLVMLATYAKTYPEGDNRPTKWFNDMMKETSKDADSSKPEARSDARTSAFKEIYGGGRYFDPVESGRVSDVQEDLRQEARPE